MAGAGTKARAAALRSQDQTGPERLAALGGLCALMAGFFLTGSVAPAALESFWVWFALIFAAIGIGSAIKNLADVSR